MKPSLRKTPDGRVVPRPGTEPGSPLAGSDLRTEPLRPFIDACLAVLPDGPLTARARSGVAVFLLGAADRFWARLGLDDRRFQPFAAALLQEVGLAPSAATALAATVDQLADDPDTRDILHDGAETLSLWLDGHDNNGVLRLNERVMQWQQSSGGS